MGICYEQVKRDLDDGKITRAEFPKVMQEKMAETLKTLSEKAKDRDTIFQENDIIIGNYIFERDDVSHQWTIVEIAQVRSSLFFWQLYTYRKST